MGERIDHAFTSTGFPVLDEVVGALHIADHRRFAGFRVLAVQHVHSSMTPLVDALCAGGVRAHDITVVGKSYSSRQPAIEALRGREVRVVDPGEMADPGRSYEIELAQQTAATAERIWADIAHTDERLLVLDEGAVATRALLARPDLAARASVVEQTTRGARWIDAAAPGFPVVDVARSRAKAEFEGPLVAASMLRGVAIALAELGRTPQRAGIIGYGRMGARIAALLRETMDVTVHDHDERLAHQARRDGLRTAGRDELLRHSDAVVGCTGFGIFTPGDIARLGRDTTLINCASSDLEFELWALRQPGSIVGGAGGSTRQPWRHHYAVDPDHRHTLVAGGFPANFYCPGEPIAPQRFQLTRALMLAGAVQATASTQPGLRPLDEDIQVVIGAAYRGLEPIGEVTPA